MQCKSLSACHSSASHSLHARSVLPITDPDVIGGYTLEAESERFISVSKVILHRLLSMTEVQARCSSTTLSGFRRFKSMRRLTRPRSMMTSGLHQLSIQSEDNSEIIYHSTWMRPRHLMTSRRPLETSSRQHMSGKKGEGKSQGPPVKGKGRGKKEKANNIKSSSGVRAQIRKMAISQVSITQQPSGKGKSQNKGSSSQHIAGPVAEQVIHQINAGGKVQYIKYMQLN
eukprot:6490748-Amphidinium_carterae.1